MMLLHNVRGGVFALNADLIERVEGEAETHITLQNGTSYVVQESLEDVVALHREDRASVHALAGRALVEHASDHHFESAPSGAALRLVEPNSPEDGAKR